MKADQNLSITKELFFPGLLLVVFSVTLISALRWEWQSFLMPLIAAGTGLLCVISEIVANLRKIGSKGRKNGSGVADEVRRYTGDLSYDSVRFLKTLREGLRFFVWVGAFFIGVRFIGFHFSIPVFSFLYLKYEGKASWLLSIVLPICLITFVWIVFDWFINIAWSEPLLMSWFR